MAVAFEFYGEELGSTDVVLHYSRSGRFRLCSSDLTYEYVFFGEGKAGFKTLTKAFTKRAAIGVQRGGGQWLRNYDELQTDDVVNAMRRVSSPVHLPGVVLEHGQLAQAVAEQTGRLRITG